MSLRGGSNSISYFQNMQLRGGIGEEGGGEVWCKYAPLPGYAFERRVIETFFSTLSQPKTSMRI